MLRYSLATLCCATLYVSLVCAALVNATLLWQRVAMTLAIAILIGSTLAAIYWRERSREFAIGFSVAGWVYFALVFTNVVQVRDQLLTESANDFLYMAVHGETTSAGYTVSVETLQTANGPVMTRQMAYTAPPVREFQVAPQPAPATVTSFLQIPPQPPAVNARVFSNISHSLWVVLVACLGGAAAQLFSRRSRRADAV